MEHEINMSIAFTKAYIVDILWEEKSYLKQEIFSDEL